MTGLPIVISESKKLRVLDHNGTSLITGDAIVSSFNEKWILFEDHDGFVLVPWTAIRCIEPIDYNSKKRKKK